MSGNSILIPSDVDGVIVRLVDAAVGSYDPKDLPEDDLDSVFVIAHSWAVTSAVVTDVTVTGTDGGIVTRATFPIAIPAALVAAKLQSHQRTKRTDEKKASDVYDIYRLLRQHDHDNAGSIAEALADAPLDLASWCADAIEASLVASSAQWARRLGVYNRGPAMGFGHGRGSRRRRLARSRATSPAAVASSTYIERSTIIRSRRRGRARRGGPASARRGAGGGGVGRRWPR